MKKIIFSFLTLALTVSLISCGGGNKSDNSANEGTSTKTETPAKGNDALAKYEALINKMIKLYESGKMKSGDASAMQELQKMSEEMAAMSTELQKEMQNLTPAEAQKFADLGQKLTDAATKAMQ